MSDISAPTRGRAGYAGFRTVIKAVATGPRGSRDLTFDEAREAGLALLSGEVSPAQAGAFLIGLRVKGEAAEELAGITQALRDRASALRPPSGADRPLVCSSGAFDGIADAPPLSLAAALCAAGAGVSVITACGGRLGPKHGITVADVLAALGGPARPTTEDSEAMLTRAGMTVVHVGEAIAGWDDLAAIRDEVGLRGPIHSAEKLVDWFGARRFVVGHTHGSYAGRLLGALERLGADRAIALRGIEGSDVLRPGRPVAVLSHAGGPVDLPERLGLVLRGDCDPRVTADLTRAIVTGEIDGPARVAVVLSAAVKVIAAGTTNDPADALRRCEAALDDGRAAAALDALVG
ncbi:anthranilate phosphoribosyltransferase [Baekduia sp. Peel2402]|uniref:anthranilate phosphoribosyltransferase n=1 Tax=Baekduia sp. Peel2402 TaxID=3458296 RepID=UPI00403EB648